MSELKKYDDNFLSESISNSSTIGSNADSISSDIQHFLHSVDPRVLGYFDADVTTKLNQYSTTMENDSDNMQHFGQWLNDTYDDYVQTVTKVKEIANSMDFNKVDSTINGVHGTEEKPKEEEEKKEEEEVLVLTPEEEEERKRKGLIGRRGSDGGEQNAFAEGGNGSIGGLQNNAASISRGSGNNTGSYASLVGLGVASVLEGVGALVEEAKEKKEAQERMADETLVEEEKKSSNDKDDSKEKEEKNDNVLLGMGIGLAAAAAAGKFVLSDDDKDEDEEKAIQKYMTQDFSNSDENKA